MSFSRSLAVHLTLAVFVAGFGAACDGNDNNNGNQNNAQPDAAMQNDAALADASPDAAPDAAAPPSCDDLQAGTNLLGVDTLTRSLILTLPDDIETGGPFPVVFAYHGLGGSATNFNNLMAPHVNTPDFHYILVTPEDTDFSVMGMLQIDWDVMAVPVIDNNIEVKLFDAVLACLETRWGVDEDAVHVVGFSMGGFLTDLIGVTRGDQLASIATYSGGYGSNSANTSVFGTLASQVSWPDPTHGRSYPQLLLHGGTTDVYNATLATLQFDVFATNDATYLNGMGHDTILCDHDIGLYIQPGAGHTIPFGANHLEPSDVVTFFKDHPRTVVDSPYASGLPAGWPTYCSFSAGL